MEFEHSVRYDAPVGEVYAMLTDAAFREKASWEQDAVSVIATVDGGKVRIEMAQPNTAIPGKPGGIQGVRRLVADGDGTLDTFEGAAKAKIPLVGGKIEALIAGRLKDGWDIEHGVGIAWLKGER